MQKPLANMAKCNKSRIQKLEPKKNRRSMTNEQKKNISFQCHCLCNVHCTVGNGAINGRKKKMYKEEETGPSRKQQMTCVR